MRNGRRRSPQTTCADFGAGSGQLPPLDPPSLFFARGLALKPSNLACHLLETLGIGVGDSDQEFLANTKRSQSYSNLGSLFFQKKQTWDPVRDKFPYHHKLESTAFATHQESAIQPNPEVAHNTSVSSHETHAFRNRRCNHTSRARKTARQKQLPHVRRDWRNHRMTHLIRHSQTAHEFEI